VESGRGEVGAGAGASAVGDVSPGVVVVGASDGFERVAAGRRGSKMWPPLREQCHTPLVLFSPWKQPE
ncbi:MAG: hypothetical protein OXE75_17830, partial [bacterium]|nr:hypothetical protein [bacterium]